MRHTAMIGWALALWLTAAAPAGVLAASVEKVAEGFASPVGMAFDAQGGLLVAEWGAGRVTRLAPDGSRSTLTTAVPSPSGLAVDAAGVVHVAAYSQGVVYRLTSDGRAEPLVRGLTTPAGLRFAADGGLLVADRGTHLLLRADAEGRARELARGLRTPVGAAELPGGLVVSEFNGAVLLLAPGRDARELTARLGHPAVGVVPLGPDAVAVADYGGTEVWRVGLDGTATVLAGGLASPVGLCQGPDGRLYVGTWGDGAVWAIMP